MKIERTKNATRNIIYGVLLKIYQLLGPFILRTIFIYTLGMEYLGLNSLFTSILSVLNLAELGVGSALVFSMYKPIAEDDKEKICALMNLYKLYYRIIGAVILVIGLILVPFIPNLISGSTPEDINIYVLYLMNLGATVLSYWLFAYKTCLFGAHQRNDVTAKVTMISSTLQYIIQAVLLIIVANYYLYLVITLVTGVFNNLYAAWKCNKMFPNYNARGHLDKSEVKVINGKVRDLFTAKVGGVIVNSADSLVISAFLGLSVLGIYNNYYYIMSSIMGFIAIIFSSCMAGIGNSLVTDSIEKNYRDFKMMTFIVGWLIIFSTTGFLCLYQPFMEIWVGKNNMFGIDIVVLFCIYFVVCELSMIWATYKDAAGIWHEDRFRPLIGATANLIMNILMVKFLGWGVYGILASTIISYLSISMPWLIYNLSKVLFKRSLIPYVGYILKICLVTIVSSLVSYRICLLINTNIYLNLIIRLVIVIIISNLFVYIIFRKNEEFKETKNLIKRILEFVKKEK